jgi:hypothetical protein
MMVTRVRSKATDDVPIRIHLVEAMKRKLAAGEVGSDSGRLADRLVDLLFQQ